jgi:hypothetical protein
LINAFHAKVLDRLLFPSKKTLRIGTLPDLVKHLHNKKTDEKTVKVEVKLGKEKEKSCEKHCNPAWRYQYGYSAFPFFSLLGTQVFHG